MKFIYFTDIHLDSGIDAFRGFELCVESMLEHQPEVLINGGDVGLIPEALAQYAQTMERVSVPVLLSHGNHEMCSGYLPREQGGTVHASADIGGVHFVLLDVVRYFEPTEDHPSNWHVLADEGLLEWLAADLAGLDRAAPLVVASSSRGLATHLWELPADFDRQQVEVRVIFEDGRECEGVLEERVWE